MLLKKLRGLSFYRKEFSRYIQSLNYLNSLNNLRFKSFNYNNNIKEMVFKNINPEQLESFLKNKPSSFYLIDVRSPEEYSHGHIDSSINIPSKF